VLVLVKMLGGWHVVPWYSGESISIGSSRL
jgi:hypothetical protein